MARHEAGRDGWRLVAVFWIIVLAAAALPMFGVGLLANRMAVDGQLGRTVAGSTYTAFIILNGLPGPLIAWMIDRMGIRYTTIAGCTLLCAAAVTSAWIVPTGPSMIILTGGLVGLGSAMGGIFPAVVAMTVWFTHRRALAIAIVMSGLSIGGALCPPVFEYVLTAAPGSWRTGWWIIAAAAGLAAVLAAAGVSDAPVVAAPRVTDNHGHEGAAAATGARRRRVHVTEVEWGAGQVFRTVPYWVFVASSVASMAAFSIFVSQCMPHMLDAGVPGTTAALLMSEFVALGLVANLLAGALGDHVDPRVLWSLGMGGLAIGLGLFVMTANTLLLALAVGLAGIGTSFGMLCILAVLANWYGTRCYAAIAGVSSAVATLGGFSAAVAGAIHDLTGSDTPAYLGIAVICLLSAVALALLRPAAPPPLGVHAA
jgi:MFS family permease